MLGIVLYHVISGGTKVATEHLLSLRNSLGKLAQDMGVELVPIVKVHDLFCKGLADCWIFVNDSVYFVKQFIRKDIKSIPNILEIHTSLNAPELLCAQLRRDSSWGPVACLVPPARATQAGGAAPSWG